MLRQKTSQLFVLIGDSPRSHLNLGRGLDTLELALS
jgi:hypothetical protein